MPLCPHSVPLPDWHCSRPRLAKLPGRCCDEWVCDDDNRIREEEEEEEEDVRRPGKLVPALPRHVDLGGNELLVAPTPWDSTAGAPEQGTATDVFKSDCIYSKLYSTCNCPQIRSVKYMWGKDIVGGF